MSGFEDYSSQAQEIEREIVRKGIALGINWDDPLEVSQLAREALEFKPGQIAGHADIEQRTRIELFALASLMLQVMKESADQQVRTHGGPVWKVFGGALWQAWETRQSDGPDQPG